VDETTFVFVYNFSFDTQQLIFFINKIQLILQIISLQPLKSNGRQSTNSPITTHINTADVIKNVHGYNING
jgi:hypothetical protein